MHLKVQVSSVDYQLQYSMSYIRGIPSGPGKTLGRSFQLDYQCFSLLESLLNCRYKQCSPISAFIFNEANWLLICLCQLSIGFEVRNRRMVIFIGFPQISNHHIHHQSFKPSWSAFLPRHFFFYSPSHSFKTVSFFSHST